MRTIKLCDVTNKHQYLTRLELPVSATLSGEACMLKEGGPSLWLAVANVVRPRPLADEMEDAWGSHLQGDEGLLLSTICISRLLSRIQGAWIPWNLSLCYILFHEKKDSQRCCDTTKPEWIHTKDESKHSSVFAFFFGMNWPVQWM